MIPAAILLSAYLVIAFGRAPLLRLDRTGAALVGAVLMVVTGAIGFDDAVRAVDVRTLALLFGMMVIANVIVVEGARKRGVSVSFAEYAKVGVPLTLLTLVFGVWWLQ